MSLLDLALVCSPAQRRRKAVQYGPLGKVGLLSILCTCTGLLKARTQSEQTSIFLFSAIQDLFSHLAPCVLALGLFSIR